MSQTVSSLLAKEFFLRARCKQHTKTSICHLKLVYHEDIQPVANLTELDLAAKLPLQFRFIFAFMSTSILIDLRSTLRTDWLKSTTYCVRNTDFLDEDAK
jgi:hypothetical protein